MAKILTRQEVATQLSWGGGVNEGHRCCTKNIAESYGGEVENTYADNQLISKVGAVYVPITVALSPSTLLPSISDELLYTNQNFGIGLDCSDGYFKGASLWQIDLQANPSLYVLNSSLTIQCPLNSTIRGVVVFWSTDNKCSRYLIPMRHNGQVFTINISDSTGNRNNNWAAPFPNGQTYVVQEGMTFEVLSTPSFE